MAQAIRQVEETLFLTKKLEAAIGPYLVVIAGAAAGGVRLPLAADAQWLGVTMEDGAINEYRSIAVMGGIVPITASAAIAEGAFVSIAGVSGQIKTAAPAAGSNSFIVGKAMEAAGAAGDVIGVLLCPCVLQG